MVEWLLRISIIELFLVLLFHTISFESILTLHSTIYRLMYGTHTFIYEMRFQDTIQNVQKANKIKENNITHAVIMRQWKLKNT